MNTGRFEEELFLVWTFVPREVRGNTVIGYIDNRKDYAETCAALAAEIDYSTKTVTLLFIPAKSGTEVANMSAAELVDGDSFITLKYDEAGWEKIVETVGALESIVVRQQAGRRRRTTRRKKQAK